MGFQCFIGRSKLEENMVSHFDHVWCHNAPLPWHCRTANSHGMVADGAKAWKLASVVAWDDVLECRFGSEIVRSLLQWLGVAFRGDLFLTGFRSLA